MSDRRIHLDGCDNARDLGDLPAAGGATTRRGILIRCDTVQQLTLADVQILVDEIGLRTVLDLRTPREAVAEGRGLLAETGAEYHNVSIVPDAYLVPGDPEHKVIVQRRSEQRPVEHYLDYLTGASGQVPKALRVMIRPQQQPLLFHCAAGKDRTGVMAALVLDLVGVDREAIIDDYVATNERLSLIGARLSALPTYGERARGDIGCAPETMREFLDTVDERWGGSAAWATSHGVAQTELDTLRKTFLI